MFKARLTDQISSTFKSIVSALGISEEEVFSFLKVTSVEVIPDDNLERDFVPLWIPESNKNLIELFAALRDLVAGEAKKRANFQSHETLTYLANSFDIKITAPHTWNAENYKSTVINECDVCIPSVPSSKLSRASFVWPKAQLYDLQKKSDFEDDNAYWFERKSDLVDLSRFPAPELNKLVVIAGPGFGKTSLTQVLSASLGEGITFPVKIHLADLCESDESILDYCVNTINRKYSCNIDWHSIFEKGNAALFLDGLDEVNTSSRINILEKVNRMTARFPNVSWMLTVRDISAVNIPVNTKNIELCPLDDQDTLNFIRAYKPNLTTLGQYNLQEKIKSQPDLRALSRIPLFLTLYLSLYDEETMISGRADLIEMYLKTLLNPEEFKAFQADINDLFAIRTIIEKTAFDALEKEEIGVKENAIIETAQAINPSCSNQIINALIKRGLLRKQSLVSLSFPFPIIQEYLAASHLLKNDLSSLEQRVQLISKRPWAQTLQFALEKHPDAEAISKIILSLPDDAFDTQLRLLGRAVANGMQISPQLKRDIVDRLAKKWKSTSWRTQHHIGQLLLDIVELPISSIVKEQLKDKYLLQSEASQILVKLNDKEIVREVLIHNLCEDMDMLALFSRMSEALAILGDETFDLISEFLKKRSDDKSFCQNVARNIDGLNGDALSPNKYKEWALNKKMPLNIRIGAYYLSPAQFEPEVIPLLEKALRSSQWETRSIARKYISKTNDEELLISFLQNSNIKKKTKIDLIWG
ncbi:MAG: hypothetical protein R3250_10555, partial [Melioribacteraceae bacterium]|nr:hypothetical protein [Melioribacteraceae bacterium]